MFEGSPPPIRVAMPGSPGDLSRRGGASQAPPGWPEKVPPPGVAGWQPAVAGWLLDQCPPEYRGHGVIRRHPVLLAWLAEQHVAAQVHAMRESYRVARVEMADVLPAGAIDAVLVTLEHEGLRLRSVQRSIELVRQALGGGSFIPRL